MYDNYRIWVIERILAKSIKRGGVGNCIEYAPTSHRYGLIRLTIDDKHKMVTVSRAMYMATHNCFDLPSSVHIRHTCDNPKCVNDEHLIKGTPKQNVQDCIERDRRAKKYKPHTRHRVHDDWKIEAIRSATGKMAWIAEEFGVSQGYVSKIKTGKLKAIIQQPTDRP